MPNKPKQPRPRKAARATPKGEAQRALVDAQHCLQELEQAAHSDPEMFSTRINAFVRSARAVPQILRKELKRNNAWVPQEEEKLIATDARYAFFVQIRDDPAHHVIIKPLEKKSVEITERIQLRGSVEADLRDPVTGKVTAHVSHSAPVGTDSGVIENTRISRAYVIDGWNEDAIIFSDSVLKTLCDLVNRAYLKFP